MATRRSYGTGSLIVRRDNAGREVFYGKWRSNGRQVMRRIGPKRGGEATDGLTVRRAEAELRRLITETSVAPATVGELLTIAEVGRRYLAHSERRGRKKSTRKSVVRVHLDPFSGTKSVNAIGPEHVPDLLLVIEAEGLSPKTIRNVMGTLSALFNFARGQQRRWASSNMCEGLELPATPIGEEIRFLTLDQVDALVEAAHPGVFHAIDRAMDCAAAITGLRQGELLALLRWRDVDWSASRIRPRQSYVLGEFGTPKSRRSTRSVPMADEVGGELDRLYQESRW
jgi:integrase